MSTGATQAQRVWQRCATGQPLFYSYVMLYVQVCTYDREHPLLVWRRCAPLEWLPVCWQSLPLQEDGLVDPSRCTRYSHGRLASSRRGWPRRCIHTCQVPGAGRDPRPMVELIQSSGCPRRGLEEENRMRQPSQKTSSTVRCALFPGQLLRQADLCIVLRTPYCI
jgi:hypothetical protein